MKRNKWLYGALAVFSLAAVVWAATGDIHTWTGLGSRRNTVEFKITSPSIGSPANFVPGTTGVNALGTSSLKFSDVQTEDINIGDDLIVTDDASIGDNITFVRQVTTPATVQSVSIATVTISPTGAFVLIGSSGAISNVGVPSITTTSATAGQWITLHSTASTVTLNDSSVVAGTCLLLTGPTVTVSTHTARTFVFSGTFGKWVLIP